MIPPKLALFGGDRAISIRWKGDTEEQLPPRKLWCERCMVWVTARHVHDRLASEGETGNEAKPKGAQLTEYYGPMGEYLGETDSAYEIHPQISEYDPDVPRASLKESSTCLF